MSMQKDTQQPQVQNITPEELNRLVSLVSLLMQIDRRVKKEQGTKAGTIEKPSAKRMTGWLNLRNFHG